MNKKFLEYRKKYLEFIYDSYQIDIKESGYEINYKFIIPKLDTFNSKIIIPKNIIKRQNIDNEFLKKLAFNIGVVESISYYKCVCPEKYIIRCDYLDDFQQKWFKKLFKNGLAEFLYRNDINIDNDLFSFIFPSCINENNDYKIEFESKGNLIAIGGGKDSCVSLDILKNESDNVCFLLNPKQTMIDCAKVAGYKDEDLYCVKRIFDKKKLIKLNSEGYLNGHTPISALIAFISYLVAYLSMKKNIILSNEASANETYVKGQMVNHQYSKSFEFEQDFYKYTQKYFSSSIKYMSLLRPLTELQIAYIFSKLKKFHKIFKSCNLGSKQYNWDWCLNCSKCLFAYITLSTFLSFEEINNIFKENLLDKENLINDFKGLIGVNINKPFECVGTIKEVNYCVNKIINKYQNEKKELPKLLKYYTSSIGLKEYNDDILNEYNKENNLDEYFNKLVMEELNGQ